MNKNNLIKICVLLLIIAIYITVFQMEWVNLVREGSFTELASVFQRWESLLFLTFLLIVLQQTFTFIPMVLLIAVNVTFFGFFYGLIWSLLASLIGSIVCFVVSRYLFQTVVLKKVSPKMMRNMEKNSFSFIFVSRLVVFIPSSVINMAAGLSSIPLRTFLLATLVGNGIYITAFSAVTFGFLSLKVTEEFLLTSLVIVSILIIILTGVIRKRVAQTKAEGL